MTGNGRNSAYLQNFRSCSRQPGFRKGACKAGRYFIEFPDIDGAFTGINEDNLAFGLEMAEEVLGMVLADYIEGGEELPKASSIQEIEATTDDMVTQKYFKDFTPVKKTLSIPKWADDMGKRAGINYSRLLTDALANAARTFEVETVSDKDYLAQK